jgi:hypothetical protein
VLGPAAGLARKTSSPGLHHHNHHPHTYIRIMEVRNYPKYGNALVATRAFSSGATVLSEEPLLVNDTTSDRGFMQRRVVASVLAPLRVDPGMYARTWTGKSDGESHRFARCEHVYVESRSRSLVHVSSSQP